jgi:hypothetical protein
VGEEGHPVETVLGPVKQVVQCSGAIGKAERVERFAGAQGRLASEEVAAMTSPSAHDGL